MDWELAKKHLDELYEKYKYVLSKPGLELPPYMVKLHRLFMRFSQGERTQDLYDQIMNFK